MLRKLAVTAAGEGRIIGATAPLAVRRVQTNNIVSGDKIASAT